MDIAVSVLIFMINVGVALANAPKVKDSRELIGVANIFCAGMMFAAILICVCNDLKQFI